MKLLTNLKKIMSVTIILLASQSLFSSVPDEGYYRKLLEEKQPTLPEHPSSLPVFNGVHVGLVSHNIVM